MCSSHAATAATVPMPLRCVFVKPTWFVRIRRSKVDCFPTSLHVRVVNVRFFFMCGMFIVLIVVILRDFDLFGRGTSNMASPSPTVVVSVLGVSRLDGENYSSHQGIGKSCLCYRFMYPGYDGYQQDHRSHCSLLALHEFESDVIQKDHFLYWGSTTRTYDVKGLSEMVHFEVLEHTVFYQDVTDKPFLINSSKKSMWSFDAYLKIALDRRLDSPCKMSYKNRDLISAPQEYGSVLFPPGIGKNKRGFVVVIDVSDSGPTFERRLRLTEKMAKHLASRKEKFVVAATKRDESFAPSLEKLSELARTCKFTLIEVSAGQIERERE